MAMSNGELRIYLVEDSPNIRNLLIDLIQPTGATVIGHASNAREALADIDELHPDVITVDILLGSGNGFDVLKGIAKKRRVDQPLRIVLTNYGTPPYRDEARRLGAEYFFDKATEIREVLTVLASTARRPNGAGVCG
jgi:two-component system response regulator DevR